ncbi:heme-copper oxidase subunit III family protein [Moritella viscosa]|uniref:Cytochrome bo(3) ubiquinol oxidase subunit 3 n=1 Tax=Moritella viscosa TaxID=80854 RepID=A0A1L0A7B8_9GAMM|nr:heme-copper oxidase subunit III family protein [Moritella viscosa]SGZ09728.1 Putative cytochrome c oxidase subunit III [Moritella viscosa]
MNNNSHNDDEKKGWQSVVSDWSNDRTVFDMPWPKFMMWVFLLSDTFIFGIFITAYMSVRMSTVDAWPNSSEVFALTIAGEHVPLVLIAIMTFILITSSGTMAMAVNFAYQGDKRKASYLIFITALFGISFVGMQAFEWSKLIFEEGVRPWSNPLGAAQFGATFFMITGFHGLHVSIGVIYLLVIAKRVRAGDYESKGYQAVEISGLYWHFVDLVWVFIFAFFYLW